MMSIGVLFLLVCPACASPWLETPTLTADHLPSVEVSLYPPAHSSAASAEINRLESSRESLESAMMKQVNRATQHASTIAQERVAQIAAQLIHSLRDSALQKSLTPGRFSASEKRKASSFLQRQSQQTTPKSSSFTVHVDKVSSPTTDFLLQSIDKIEEERAAKEKRMFEQYLAEITELPNLVVSEFQAQITKHFHDMKDEQVAVPTVGSHEQTSFMQTSTLSTHAEAPAPTQAHVRVVESSAQFPTVESDVQDIESRRDDAEKLIREQIHLAKLNVLRIANVAAKNSLDYIMNDVMSNVDAMAFM